MKNFTKKSRQIVRKRRARCCRRLVGAAYQGKTEQGLLCGCGQGAGDHEFDSGMAGVRASASDAHSALVFWQCLIAGASAKLKKHGKNKRPNQNAKDQGAERGQTDEEPKGGREKKNEATAQGRPLAHPATHCGRRRVGLRAQEGSHKHKKDYARQAGWVM
jgi:hypothetical protein